MSIIKCFNKECDYYDDTDQPDNCSHSIVEIQKCYKAIIRKDSPIKSKNWYHQQLLSDECYCMEPKRPRHAFCYACYLSLPDDIQRDLYQLIGKGYEPAYEAAIKFLEAC